MNRHADFRRGAGGRCGLTSREAEVLGWIAHGKQNAEIAQLLFISPHIVRKHVENIFQKLDVRTRTAAVAALRYVDAVPGGAAPSVVAATSRRSLRRGRSGPGAKATLRGTRNRGEV